MVESRAMRRSLWIVLSALLLFPLGAKNRAGLGHSNLGFLWLQKLRAPFGARVGLKKRPHPFENWLATPTLPQNAPEGSCTKVQDHRTGSRNGTRSSRGGSSGIGGWSRTGSLVASLLRMTA